MSKRQIFEVSGVDLVDRTITLKLVDGPEIDAGSLDFAFPDPWFGAYGDRFELEWDGIGFNLKGVI